MRTLKLIDEYLKIMEQAEEVPDDSVDQTDATEVVEPEPEVMELTSEGEKYLTSLLIKAFAYVPSDEELKIVDGLNVSMRDTNPKEIVETIEKFLQISEDEMRGVLDRVG